MGGGQGCAHGRLALGGRLEPDRKFEFLLDEATGAVVHLARALLNPQGIVGDGADGHQAAAGQGAAEAGSGAAAVADDADVEVVADAFGLRTFQGQVLQQAIDDVRDALGLVLLLVAPERLQHRRRLVHEKEKAGRIGSAYFRNVGHGKHSKKYERHRRDLRWVLCQPE